MPCSWDEYKGRLGGPVEIFYIVWKRLSQVLRIRKKV
jgi:hypothetical protein